MNGTTSYYAVHKKLTATVILQLLDIFDREVTKIYFQLKGICLIGFRKA